MSKDKPRCRHCGATTALPPTKSGNLSTVCLYCRRNQVNARRGSSYRAARLAEVVSVKPSSRHANPASGDGRLESIRRAQVRARREGLSLARALELEGV